MSCDPQLKVMAHESSLLLGASCLLPAACGLYHASVHRTMHLWSVMDSITRIVIGPTEANHADATSVAPAI